MTPLLLLLTGALASAASPQPESVSLVVNGGLRVCTKGKPGCRMPDMTNAQDIKIELAKTPGEEGQVGDTWHGVWSHPYSDKGVKFTLQVSVTKMSEPDGPDSAYSMEFQITPEPPSGGSPQLIRMSLASPKNLNRFRWDASALPGGSSEEEASPVLYFGLD